MSNEFVLIYSKYLAGGLSFLGHRYYKKTIKGQTVFSFKNTEMFQKDLYSLFDLREKNK